MSKELLNDYRLTAYALNELEGEDKVQFELELLTAHSSVLEEINKIKRMSNILEQTLNMQVQNNIEVKKTSFTYFKEEIMKKINVSQVVIGLSFTGVMCLYMFNNETKKEVFNQQNKVSMKIIKPLTDEPIIKPAIEQEIDRLVKTKSKIQLAKELNRLNATLVKVGKATKQAFPNGIENSNIIAHKKIVAKKELLKEQINLLNTEGAIFSTSKMANELIGDKWDNHLRNADQTWNLANSLYDFPISDSTLPSSFKYFKANDFKDAQKNYLSTFSVNINSASYTYFRQAINNKEVPTPESIKTEEFINYFDYNYDISDTDTVKLSVSQIKESQLERTVRVSLKAKDFVVKNKVPSHLTFLIDTSGSMMPNIELVRNSLELLVNKMNDNDKVSIITYAGNEQVVIKNESNKSKIKEALKNHVFLLGAYGRTNGQAGIIKAYDIARKGFIKKGNNRILLLTDGDFNVGLTDENSLADYAQTMAKNNIYLTVLGFGFNLNDKILDEVSKKAQGNYFFIDSITESVRILNDRIYSTMSVAAKDVKIQVEFNPNLVKEYKLVGYETRELKDSDFKDDTKDASEMGFNNEVTALYKIKLHKKIVNTEGELLKFHKTVLIKNDSDILNVKVRYKEESEAVSKEISQILNKDSIQDDENFKWVRLVSNVANMLKTKKYKELDSYIKQGKEFKNLDNNKKEFLELLNQLKDNLKFSKTTTLWKTMLNQADLVWAMANS